MLFLSLAGVSAAGTFAKAGISSIGTVGQTSIRAASAFAGQRKAAIICRIADAAAALAS